MSEHDMQTRINQVKKFATNGHPLKVTLMLK
jgi:translation initiation factor IF-3